MWRGIKLRTIKFFFMEKETCRTKQERRRRRKERKNWLKNEKRRRRREVWERKEGDATWQQYTLNYCVDQIVPRVSKAPSEYTTYIQSTLTHVQNTNTYIKYPFEYHTVFKFKSDKNHFTVWRSSIFSLACVAFIVMRSMFVHEDRTRHRILCMCHRESKRQWERQSGGGGSHCTNLNVCLQCTLNEKENEKYLFSGGFWLFIRICKMEMQCIHALSKHTSTHTHSYAIAVQSQNNSKHLNLKSLLRFHCCVKL